MVEDFADLANSKDAKQRKAYVNASLKTQEYLDAAWRAVTG
jgi:hypothetical protein